MSKINIGDMTLKQVIEYCDSHACHWCQLKTENDNCVFHVNRLKTLNLDTDIEILNK